MTDFKGNGTHSEDWGTPQSMFDRLNEIYDFTLDVCAANAQVAKCRQFFTPEIDGLKTRWFGRPFCNPPYGRGEVKKWVMKAIKELSCANVESVVFLIPASVGSLWFHDYVLPYAKTIWLVRGRVSFEDYEGNKNTGGTNFDSVIVEMVLKQSVKTQLKVWVQDGL